MERNGDREGGREGDKERERERKKKQKWTVGMKRNETEWNGTERNRMEGTNQNIHTRRDSPLNGTERSGAEREGGREGGREADKEKYF